jgi:hypothetical protein
MFTILRKGIYGYALMSIFAVALLAAPVQTARAQGLPVIDFQNTFTNTLQTISQIALEQKELVWDGLFFSIAKEALQQMTQDIIEWVNSGFDGDPAFVTDLEGYLQSVADNVAGSFIYEDGLSSVCSAYQLDVRTAIAKQYQERQYGGFEEEAACTIEDSESDLNAFLDGEFRAGDWSLWFEVVLNPEETPIGAFIGGTVALNEAINTEAQIELQYLDYGNGFFSQKVCSGVGQEEECTITTPGSIIQDMLSFSLTTPARTLIEADEMNEVLGALFSNLANQALSGINGLLGLGGNATWTNNSFGADGNSSYLDATAEEDQGNATGDTSSDAVERAFDSETEVLELQMTIIAEIEEVNSLFESEREPFADDSCWNLDVPGEFTDKLEELLVEIPETLNTLIALEGLVTALEEANSTQEQLPIFTELSRMQSEGLLGGQTAVIEYEYYLNTELRPLIQEFEADIESEVDGCS